MESEPGQPAAEPFRRPKPSDVAFLTTEEMDAMETLAEFETEHRRMLSMQSLYYKRRKAGGVA